VTESEPIRILCMEDDPGLARLVQKKLGRAGYIVDLAYDGEEGLDKHATGTYDALIVDQAMPGCDGLEVIRILASQGRLRPTVMVTGAGDERIAVQAMKLGAHDYIVKDADGRYLQLLPTVVGRAIEQQRLVDQRQRAEDGLRESEARYRGLFEGVPVGLYRTTSHGQILDANPALVQMLGYPDREALMALDANALYVSAEDRQRWQTLMDREGVLRGFEMQLRRRDGTLIWVRDTARVIPGGDAQTHYYEGSLEDITERKRLEERVRQKDRMAALGRLAGGIAHDFNNILTGITLSAQMLLAERRLPRDLVPDLESIVEDARRAARLVAQILDFARGSYFETHPVEMRTFIHGTADVLRRTLPENIQILMELGPGEYVVDANPDRLEQVLVILAANARDAMTSSSSDFGELSRTDVGEIGRAVEMPEGGELRIGLSRIDLRPAEEPPVAGMGIGEWVCLSVSDTGVGISPDAMPHLFEPFFTTKDLGQGTGMGLAQMHGIVTQHGGHIGVTTDVGRGTTFYIYLPVYQAEQAAEVS